MFVIIVLLWPVHKDVRVQTGALIMTEKRWRFNCLSTFLLIALNTRAISTWSTWKVFFQPSPALDHISLYISFLSVHWNLMIFVSFSDKTEDLSHANILI